MKTVSRYASSAPIIRSESIGSPKLPEHCEVPGCESLYVGRNKNGQELHKCGKADVLVDDYSGRKRGICAEHYLRGLVKAGKAANQDLVDRDGRIAPGLAAEMRERLNAGDSDYIVHPRVVA